VHNNDKIEIELKNKENVILLGNPNVGKSVIFSILTGKYVTVSNYPGTTVEVVYGTSTIENRKVLLIDTPGTNSLIPQSEDELVARNILLTREFKNVIQVADSKNLRRALLISLQLAEAEIPFLLNLNMDDEAKSLGIEINKSILSKILNVNIVSTIATQRAGIKALEKNVLHSKYASIKIKYDGHIEAALEKLIPLIPETRFSKRFTGLLLLSNDYSMLKFISDFIDEKTINQIRDICKALKEKYSKPINYIINQTRYKKVDSILANIMIKEVKSKSSIAGFIGKISMHPVWGVPVAILVMILMYKIVGEFGAGICVDFFESVVFGEFINPFFENIFKEVPFEIIRELFVGEYGIITMALTYAIAIVLPIVGFFFLIFGILEDTGYLPRLAIMVNRVFKVMGLNGKAILPMILGLGCDTMATMTTRILPSKKERIIVTLLLALAVPCSAQLGVIFGATSTISVTATLIWVFTIIFIIFIVGFFSSKIVYGKSSDFILEIPPMRMPKMSNIVIKTLARLSWYLKEAVPLFMLGTLLLFIFSKTGFLIVLEEWAAPVVVNLLQLPKEAASAFVMGFLRRDYAAVMLYKGGNLDNIQMLVSIVTITLFVPCIANLFIMIKERGFKVAMFITAFIFIFAFLFGGAFNFIIRALNIPL